jgi:DNA-binding transcriptional ArsR family regulator
MTQPPLVFSALGDPTRCAIVAMLSQGERDVTYIAGAFSISGPAVSQHLKTLRNAGVVRVRAQAQRRYYSLDKAAMAGAADWLMRMGGFWETRLDALEAALRKEEVGNG